MFRAGGTMMKWRSWVRGIWNH